MKTNKEKALKKMDDALKVLEDSNATQEEKEKAGQKFMNSWGEAYPVDMSFFDK